MDVAAILTTVEGVAGSDSVSVEAGAGTIASVEAVTTAIVVAVVAGVAAGSAPEADTTATVKAGTLSAAASVAGAYTLPPGLVPHPQTHPSAPLGSSASSQ